MAKALLRRPVQERGFGPGGEVRKIEIARLELKEENPKWTFEWFR